MRTLNNRISVTLEDAFQEDGDSAETPVMKRWPHKGRIIQAEETAIRCPKVTLSRQKMKKGRVQAMIVKYVGSKYESPGTSEVWGLSNNPLKPSGLD